MGEHVRLRTGEVIFARVADDAEADWFPAAVDVTAGVVEAENCQVVTGDGELCDLRGYARRNPGLQLASNPLVIVQVADQPREPSAFVQALRAAERAKPTGGMRPIRLECCREPHPPIHQCQCGC